jgi:ATP-dependent DNA ligase
MSHAKSIPQILARLIRALPTTAPTKTMASLSFVQPMLATRVSSLPTGPGWQYEVKWDGYRILAVKNASTVKLFSRRGSSYTEKFKSVTKAVTGIHAQAAAPDGEVVAN